ncbi:MAG: nucleotidyltransferase family protein [Verrucomicrobia bacterium]|nr:nucleotidyltransferase family protein [Verrucomicrobiota bacterium]
MKTLSAESVLSFLTDHMVEITSAYGVRSIGIFGSIVRGTAGPDSDVDILVEFNTPTFDHYMDLKFYLEDAFGRPVDLVTKSSLKSRLRAPILQEVQYAA